MSLLSNQQKQLLFDYCIGLTSEGEAAEAEALISSNEEAAEIHSKLKAALAPLESAEFEPCPDELAEGTIWRLNNLARSSQLHLQQLLASEQARGVTTMSRFWWNLGKVAASAAVILIVLGTWFAPFGFARHKYRQLQCQRQLARIFQGIGDYGSDHNGRMPAVASAAGAPWWKLGDQGSNNHSNTRHIWLLVKGDYVNPADFACPGKRKKLAILLDPSVVKNYNDFPSRGHITYSFRIRCGESQKKTAQGRKVLMADLNPLFERLPGDYSKPFKREPNIDMLIRNSTNHNRRGQNVLFADGSVEFVKVRSIGVAEDDIFTLQNTNIYKGVEVPSCETDCFLAP